MAYSKQYNGYVADVPHMWFKRNDGRIFYFDELTQATITPQINYTEVNAGWSLYPVAYLPGQSTFEMQITSGKFEADLFTMTNGTEFSTNESFLIPKTEHISAVLGATTIADSEKKDTYISLDAKTAATVDTATISIRGFDSSSGTIAALTKADATYVIETKVDSTDKTTVTGIVIHFAQDNVPVGTEVEVSYYYKKEVQEAKIDNRSSAVGEAVLVYPVYGAGDQVEAGSAKFSEGSINGYVIVKVYKARVTAQPGLDGSYKSASTFQFTLATLDPKKDDGEVYSIAYVQNVEEL